MPPVIAITMGDPAGVGPELCLRAMVDTEVGRKCVPVVLGDASVLEACAARTGLPAPLRLISLTEWERGMAPDGPAVLDLKAIALSEFTPGTINAATGRAAFAYVDRAIDAALAGRVAAVTTAPLNKEALHMAGHRFPGHTEIFAERTRAERWCMMQYSEAITCTFVTVHTGYADVPALLTSGRILDVIELTAAALRRIRGREPVIVVCGLNPHAGEHGLFGRGEEECIIVPAVAAARDKGIQVEGPVPPDTAFTPSKRNVTDAFVCMYHDQGHIPVKALAFDAAVNTTLGLPVIRTSVDHGTALDIAWQGKANPGSLFAAIGLAVTLCGESPLR